MARFFLAIGLIMLSGCAAKKPVAAKVTQRYVPVKCIAHLVVKNWGKCTVSGSNFDCPNSHTSFIAGCTSTADDGQREFTGTIERPTAVLVEIMEEK